MGARRFLIWIAFMLGFKMAYLLGWKPMYRIAYLLGLKPWDSGMIPPELAEWVEGPTALPPGRALDIGCGTGTHSKYLQDHGWEVTGVDFMPRALEAAKQKAPGARLLCGDVTKLGELGVTGPFDLMLDQGCFHSIPDPRRDAYVFEAAKVAAPSATFLLFGFAERGPGGIHAPETEIRRRFGGDFDIAEVRRVAVPGTHICWYRMIRKSTFI